MTTAMEVGFLTLPRFMLSLNPVAQAVGGDENVCCWVAGEEVGRISQPDGVYV
jgi:hypothetical protein